MSVGEVRPLKSGEFDECQCSAQENHDCEDGWHWTISPGCLCGRCQTAYVCHFCTELSPGAVDY